MRRDGAEELPEAAQRLPVEGHPQAPPPRPRQLDEGRHQHRHERPRRHAVAEQHLGEAPLDQAGEDPAVLEGHPQPERDPRHGRRAVVEAVAQDELHALHEEQPQEHDDVGGSHRRRDRDQDRGELGQEGEREQHHPDHDPTRRAATPVTSAMAMLEE